MAGYCNVDRGDNVICPNCGRSVERRSPFCMFCGAVMDNYMSLKRKAIIINLIGLFTVIVIASVIIFYALSNRYYIDSATHVRIDRFTGDMETLSDLLNTPKPTTKPSWENESTPQAIHVISPTPTPYKGDVSKVVIAGNSCDNSNPYMNIITCTIENKDTVKHNIFVKAIYYDKKNSPISTQESESIVIKPGDMESATISMFDNASNISYYELKVEESEF